VDPARAPAPLLRHARTGASLSLQLYDDAGRIRRFALAQLRAFLAEPGTGADHPVHWRLAALLVAAAARWPGHELQVVSGYRSSSRHAARSNHTRGRAVDFRVVGVPHREVFEVLRASFDDIGVGYYPNSSFVHLDVRERPALWVDFAGPGEDACYSPQPRSDLGDGTAERLDPTAARRRGCAPR
jgi:uncharacterized protein YcbK (DUF882 family)